METSILNTHQTLATAKERVRVGAVPEWVTQCSFDPSFIGKPGVPVTDLLVNRQHHAERRQTYVHTARRLEDMQAVQHESQWRLQFEPVTEFVTLHWIAIHRGKERFDHTNLEKARLIQREEGLDRFVLDGWFTLLLVMDDVRVGDVLETCYTMDSQPRLLPGHCTAFFSLVPGVPVGRFSFSVRFDITRTMRWKSSSAELVPAERQENGEMVWDWMGSNQLVPELEINTPQWQMAYPWMQISDCPDWGTVAAAIASAWKDAPDDPTLGEIAKAIANNEPDPLRRVEQAIQLVQDEYRYLSVNLELGGQVPTPPATVAQRRFGDCKDLSFLLVHLLRRLEVEARPVLVNTSLGKSITALLPTPNLFNHAVVEFKVQGQSRWVDATIRRQGGGALRRILPEFGVGLPVDAGATALINCPQIPGMESVYEITESLLLDTTGSASLLSVKLRATGSHADSLRHQLEIKGLEKFTQERLQICASRYANAVRPNPLQFRDDRATNEFVLVEVFEVKGFLAPHPEPGMCTFQLPYPIVLDVLRFPEKADQRKTSLALPFPCNISHNYEVESSALRPMAAPRCSLSSPFVQFSRRQKSLHKYWSNTLNLVVLADAVPADCFAEHEKLVEKIW